MFGKITQHRSEHCKKENQNYWLIIVLKNKIQQLNNNYKREGYNSETNTSRSTARQKQGLLVAMSYSKL